jgi:glycine oxidase
MQAIDSIILVDRDGLAREGIALSASSRFAVVGAGIIGLTTAFELMMRGHDVVVYDREAPGAGTSIAANGAITPYSDETIPPTVVQLAEQSLRLYPSHVARLRDLSHTHVAYDEKGVLQVVLESDDHDRASKHFGRMTSAGWPVKWLSSQEALNLERNLTPGASAAIHYISESRIDTAQIIEATIVSLRQLGCTFSYPTRVVRVSPSRSYTRVETTAGSSTYDGAVIATGGNLQDIEHMPKIKIERIRGEIVEAIGPPGLIDACLYRGDAFITPRRDGRLLLGTSYVKHTHGMDTNRATVSIRGMRKTIEAAFTILPALDSCEVRRVWKGWRPTPIDGIPIIGRYEASNIVISDGYGGLGYTLALAAAKLATNLVTEPTTLENMVLSPSRFTSE